MYLGCLLDTSLGRYSGHNGSDKHIVYWGVRISTNVSLCALTLTAPQKIAVTPVLMLWRRSEERLSSSKVWIFKELICWYCCSQDSTDITKTRELKIRSRPNQDFVYKRKTSNPTTLLVGTENAHTLTSTTSVALCLMLSGLTMWRVSAAGLVSPRGTSVRRLWRGLPPDLPRIQAVLERESDHAIIFISGGLQ